MGQKVYFFMVFFDTFSSLGLNLKASGGIRDKQTALKMIEAGASRLGTSSGVKIVS